MAITFGDNIIYQGKKPLDSRAIFSTISAMKNYSENYLPNLAICQNEEDGNLYVYNSSASSDENTGKWRIFSGGSGDYTAGKAIEITNSTVESEVKCEWYIDESDKEELSTIDLSFIGKKVYSHELNDSKTNYILFTFKKDISSYENIYVTAIITAYPFYVDNVDLKTLSVGDKVGGENGFLIYEGANSNTIKFSATTGFAGSIMISPSEAVIKLSNPYINVLPDNDTIKINEDNKLYADINAKHIVFDNSYFAWKNNSGEDDTIYYTATEAPDQNDITYTKDDENNFIKSDKTVYGYSSDDNYIVIQNDEGDSIVYYRAESLDYKDATNVADALINRKIVSVSESGTATDIVNYITVNGVEKKIHVNTSALIDDDTIKLNDSGNMYVPALSASVSSVNNVSAVSGNITIDSDDIQYTGGKTYYAYEHDEDADQYLLYSLTEEVTMDSILYNYDEDTKTFTVFNDEDNYIDSVDEDAFNTMEYGSGPYRYYRNGEHDIKDNKTVTQAIKDAKTVYSGDSGITANDTTIGLALTDIQKAQDGIYGYNPAISAWEYAKSNIPSYEQVNYAEQNTAARDYILNKPVFTSGLTYVTPYYNEVHVDVNGLTILNNSKGFVDTIDLDGGADFTLLFDSNKTDVFYLKFPLEENTTIDSYANISPLLANNEYDIEKTVVKDKNILKYYPGQLYATFYANEDTKSLPKVDFYIEASTDSTILKAVCTPDSDKNYYDFNIYVESPVLELLNSDTNIVKLSLTNAQSANAVYGYNPAVNAWQIAEGTGGTYTNLTPVPKDIGGIAKGETFNGLTYQEMFDKLLYPYIEWNFGTFSITAAAGTYEYGTSKTVSAWQINATAGTSAITSLTFTDSKGNTTAYTDPTFPVSYTLSTSVTLDGTTNYSVTAEATDGKTSKSTHADINFTKYKYYATSTSDTTIPTEGEQLSDSGTSITTTAGQYIWAFTPTNTTSLAIKQYVNGSWSDVAGSHYVGSVTFTLKSGATLTYYAYVTAKMVAATGKYKLA